MIDLFINNNVSGVTGNVSINDNGDRTADYRLLDMDPKTGKFQTVMIYRGLTAKIEDTDTKIHWCGNRDSPPPDSPKCGFDGSLCESAGKYG